MTSKKQQTKTQNNYSVDGINKKMLEEATKIKFNLTGTVEVEEV